MVRTLVLLGAATVLAWAGRTERSQNPVELGTVSWYRNYDEARAIAKKTDRDLFVLFQEVPG